jgi:hypothetical protein
MISWQFLVLGSFGAVGVALALGTLAALGQYKRHGHFPNASPGDEPPTRKQFVGLWARVVIGVALGIAGFVSLAAQNLS